MTQEEKLVEAKRLYKTANADQRYVLESLFPELKRSEDEKIKEDLIQWIDEFPDIIWRGHQKKNVLAWLEKQGEQKSADKIKPKFNEGDFIKHNKANIICKVISVNNGSYYVDNIETNGGIELFNAEQNFHLWTIQDAKDGDVLVVPPVKGSEHSEQIFIFKKIKDREYVKNAVEYYCRCMDNEFAVNKRGFMGQSDDYFTPATKEQQDLLFQKMKEAGYEWDAENKELKKKIRHTPGWTEEDEVGLSDALWAIEQAKTIAKDENDMGNLWYAEKWLKTIKKLYEQQPAWSEKDEHRLKDTIYFLDTAKKHYASTVELDACINWLESLKQRNSGNRVKNK